MDGTTNVADAGHPAGEPAAGSVARYLRERIHDGTLAPGTHVRQETVANDLGVSRLPVREALRQLESEGLVVIRPHSGARIAVLDFEEHTDIYKIRERLEPLALAESIPHLSAEQIAHVDTLLGEVEAAAPDPPGFLDADRRFHLACYAGVPTRRLLRTIEGLWNETQRYRRILLTTFTDADYETVAAEHRLIADAIRAGNVRAGEDVVRMHIERSRLRLAAHRELFDADISRG
ncbi:GntR family transcriptional regulator [Phytoactinopolyspora limicola]|uniref:GntR family transcriptional regulator n=1 Tax=Phytoactinopolyspora limicola TaxID=2715536 RepID=UPI00140907FA|nr:GntR family transcriptional regulator [Phytoactinopolyspora limicola]